MQKQLQFKHKKSLPDIIMIAVGIILIFIGVSGYFWLENMIFVYLIILANILIIYSGIKFRIRKGEVVYDYVFIKYRLGKKRYQRIELKKLIGVERNNTSLSVELKDEEDREIELEGYDEESIVQFEELIRKFCPSKE